MFLFKGESPNVIHFNPDEINVSIAQDGWITIPEGKCEIRIRLGGVYKDLLENGFTLKGYGFAVKSLYIE
jgi:hypothetical protein